nr:retrotransposon Gag domain, retroviral aspartyl protease [Tanacetum cinerariifolium]
MHTEIVCYLVHLHDVFLIPPSLKSQLPQYDVPEAKMVQTRNNPDTGSGANDPIATQLAAIAAKLEAMESLKEDIADLKRQAATKQRSGDGGTRRTGIKSLQSQPPTIP